MDVTLYELLITVIVCNSSSDDRPRLSSREQQYPRARLHRCNYLVSQRHHVDSVDSQYRTRCR
jgi:hypothetical protein